MNLLSFLCFLVNVPMQYLQKPCLMFTEQLNNVLNVYLNKKFVSAVFSVSLGTSRTAVRVTAASITHPVQTATVPSRTASTVTTTGPVVGVLVQHGNSTNGHNRLPGK